VKIDHDSQDVNVLGLSPGKNDIVLTTPASHFVDILGTVTVLLDVKVFFHFVGGPPGIKTSRTPGVEAAFIRDMNKIYRRQVGIVFASAGVNPSLAVPGVEPVKDASGRPGVRTLLHGSTDHQKAIVKNRNPSFLFNVFFVGDFVDFSSAMGQGPDQDYLAVTTCSDHAGNLIRRLIPKDVPGRCCMCRDLQPRDPAGINFGRTLAHEAGHALDEDDIEDETKKDHLMWWQESTSTGSKIPFLSAFDMLQSAIQFPP
jgi:hypothetical protein